MRNLEIVLPKNYYVAGETIRGYVTLECDKGFDANAIHITLNGKEKVYFTRGSGDNRRTYDESHQFLAERIMFMDEGHVQEGHHRYDFEFRLPEHTPSSYRGPSGRIIYALGAKVEISWALDPQATCVLIVTTPLTADYEKGTQASVVEDGMMLLGVETEHSSFCIGGDLRFKFRISRDLKLDGIRMDLIHKEEAHADGATDTSYRTMATNYFEEAAIRREDWLTVKLNTEKTIPPSFRTKLIKSIMNLKVTVDIPWRFDKSVEIPIISGWCLAQPVDDTDHLFGDF